MATARRPVLTVGCVVGLLLVSSLATGQPGDSKRRENLTTCLSGRYPALCDHSMLSPDELKATLEAERRENLKTCLTGRYPALCKHELLTATERAQVREAERQENLKVCLAGRYPLLCNQALLTPDELQRTREAERAENLKTCLMGRFSSLCNHSLLSPSEAERVAAAEKSASSAAPTAGLSPRPASRPRTSTSRGRSRPSGSDCESGHWIESVSDDGDIIKLEDGSVWEVDDVDTVTSTLWLPTTDVIVCEMKGKMINVDDNESVAVRRLK